MSANHGINIPGVLLDELKSKDYSNDERFSHNKKRGPARQISRKEKRKQQRADKKNKRSKRAIAGDENTPRISKQENEKDPSVERKEKVTKTVRFKKSEEKNEESLPFSSDDELSSGDFDEFDEGDLDEEEWQQLKELEGEDEEAASDDDEEIDDELSDDEDEDDDESMTAEETMAKLKQLKLAKAQNANGKSKIEKTKSKSKPKKSDEDDEPTFYPMTPAERAAIERDEMDMQYYAKKLKLKGKKKSIHASDEFDAIGGLLEGLDYFENFGKDDEEYGDLAIKGKNVSASESEDESASESESESESADENEERGEEEHIENPFSSDDELSSGDFDEFDDDLDEEEWEQLQELEQGSSSRSRTTKERENPYVAPIAAAEEESSTYIPPSLRRKQFIEADNEDSEILAEIRKQVKSSLNKLSDSNITIIITSLNDLFDKYSRNYVIDVVTKQILGIIGQRNKLLDGFIMNYAAVAFALFKLRGSEVGATFVQAAVESFLTHYEEQLKRLSTVTEGEAINLPKECNNIITLLSYCYNFGFISCRLVYDLIRMFVAKPNEVTTELLLRVVSVSGQLIRGDDPSALKEILSELLTNVKSLETQSPRLQFLLSTLSDLKNNRLKPSVIAIDFHPLKRNLATVLKSSASGDALQVSLDDIKNVETKGKWWLIGASWKGNMTSAFDTDDSKTTTEKKSGNKITIEDELLDDIPDWGQIAREQRMNTDIRRAIFISIMSAQDYVDAFEKLEKLNLKNKQILEVPRVLLHCLLTDAGQNGYNPYYSLVACKLCEQHHQLLKSFQFLFWDIIKKFEDNMDSDSDDDLADDDDFEGSEEGRLKKIMNQGRFFGYLLSESVLKLDGFKHVPIMGGLNKDGMMFIEVLLFQMLLSLGKKSEKKNGKDSSGKRLFKYNAEFMSNILSNGLKLENRATIMKGLQWFINKKLKYKNYLVGVKGEKGYERDKRRIEWARSKFLDIIDNELDSIDH